MGPFLPSAMRTALRRPRSRIYLGSGQLKMGMSPSNDSPKANGAVTLHTVVRLILMPRCNGLAAVETRPEPSRVGKHRPRRADGVPCIRWRELSKNPLKSTLTVVERGV